jgi:hypothetical protein
MVVQGQPRKRGDLMSTDKLGVVVHVYNSSYIGGRGRKIVV